MICFGEECLIGRGNEIKHVVEVEMTNDPKDIFVVAGTLRDKALIMFRNLVDGQVNNEVAVVITMKSLGDIERLETAAVAMKQSFLMEARN